MKNRILSFSLLVFLLSGCSINQATESEKAVLEKPSEIINSKPETREQKINSNQKEVAENNDATTSPEKILKDDEILGYINKKNNFSIDYPKDWIAKEGLTADNFFTIFFSKGKTQFGVLPKGGLDFGLPFEKPAVKKITLDNKKAVRQEWQLKDGNFLIIINFLEFPQTWDKDNRFNITGKQNEIAIFDKMIKSFRFVE
jgi:hypothetical protein